MNFFNGGAGIRNVFSCLNDLYEYNEYNEWICMWVNYCNTKCNNTYLFHIIIFIIFIIAIMTIIMDNTF